MENIDDLMRQKFDSDNPEERFEFQEEYWEQAKVLLEQEDARRRRWMWLLIGLVLAMALGLWLLLGPSGNLSQKEGAVGSSTTVIDPKDNKDNQPGVDGKSGAGTQNIETIKSSGDTIGETEQSIATRARSSLSETASNQNLGTTKIKRKDRRNLSGKNTKASAGIIASDAQVIDSDETNPGSDPNRRTKKAGDSEKEPTETARKKEKAVVSLLSENGQTSNRANQNAATITPDKNAQETSNPSITNIPISQYPNIPILNLPTPLTPLAWPQRALKPRKGIQVAQKPIANHKKAAESQRLSLGISLAGAAYQQSDSSGRWAGWALGGYGAYRLNKRISLMLGAQYRFVPGYGAPSDDSNPVEVTQLRYSFGYKSEVWKRETRGLHFLEIPISAHWNKGRWDILGGLAAGVLLAVQNQTEHTQASSLEAAKTTVKKFIKGDAALYNASYFSAFAGAEYHLNDWLSVTALAQYRFTPALKKAADGGKNSGFGNVEAGLRVRLF